MRLDKYCELVSALVETAFKRFKKYFYRKEFMRGQYWRVNYLLFLLILQCFFVVMLEQFKMTVEIAEI